MTPLWPPMTLVLPADILSEAVPGNIRQAQSFLSVLKRFVHHLKVRVGVTVRVSVRVKVRVLFSHVLCSAS